MFNFLKPKKAYLLRYEDEQGWDLLGIYITEELAQEGVMDALKKPDFLKGVLTLDEVTLNDFWPNSFKYAPVTDGGS